MPLWLVRSHKIVCLLCKATIYKTKTFLWLVRQCLPPFNLNLLATKPNLIDTKLNQLATVPLWLVKSPPWIMNCGFTYRKTHFEYMSTEKYSIHIYIERQRERENVFIYLYIIYIYRIIHIYIDIQYIYIYVYIERERQTDRQTSQIHLRYL